MTKKDVYTKETGKCPHILPGFDPTWSCYSPIVLLLLDTMDTWDNAKLQIIQKLPQKLSACKIPLVSFGLLNVFLGGMYDCFSLWQSFARTYGGCLGTRVSSMVKLQQSSPVTKESFAKWTAKCLSRNKLKRMFLISQFDHNFIFQVFISFYKSN
ncbi:hypothetical protein MJO28_015091 [Puccinia striiformis f. sp. tritici]|uniref:Uncharacterized protein n=1 Tax=Puccinia striiformis f. sp. tritici TaxID=168172 RepID=A0ACC0DSS4_9BASI|nr:hypothetical protein MJO28_015091 [Puccinia striiformis f. sp. tritici]